MKKFITNSLVVALVVLFCFCLIYEKSVKADENVELTRAQWAHMLVETFEMEVEEDNYPDNYYSDVETTSDIYRDLMILTEFGVIEYDAGEPFYPEKAADERSIFC